MRGLCGNVRCEVNGSSTARIDLPARFTIRPIRRPPADAPASRAWRGETFSRGNVR